SWPVPALLPPDLFLEFPGVQLPGRVEPHLFAALIGDPGDFPDFGPRDLPRVEGGFDRGKLLQAPGEEDELVRALLLGEVLPGPLRGILAGPEHLPLVHVVEVETERTLGHLALALVEMDPFDEFLLRQTRDEQGGYLHDFPSTSLQKKLSSWPFERVDSTPGFSGLRKRAETALEGARRSGLAKVATNRK